MNIQSFTIAVSQTALDDLHQRLTQTKPLTQDGTMEQIWST